MGFVSLLRVPVMKGYCVMIHIVGYKMMFCEAKCVVSICHDTDPRLHITNGEERD